MVQADVRSARRRLGLTQDKLAEKLGVTRNTVSRWERGEVSPSPENLAALDRLFAQLEKPAPAEEAPVPTEETAPPAATSARAKGPFVLACVGFVCALLIGIAALIGFYSVKQQLEPDNVIPAEEIEREEVGILPIVSGTSRPLQP